FSAQIFSQAPPPPPPPLIFSAPTAANIKEFRAESFGFKSDFPGIPQNVEEKLKVGKGNVFKSRFTGADYLVRVIEFDFNVEKSVDSSQIFEIFKTKYLDDPSNEIVSEKTVTFNGKNAKEFEVKDTFYFNKVKVIINEDRIYEIFINVTNWHILSKYNPEKVKEFQNEADRFHSSFQFIETPNRSVNKTVKQFEKGKFSIFPSIIDRETGGIGGISGKPVLKPPFESKTGGFKIQFPSVPTEKVTPFQSGYGAAEMHQFSLFTALSFYGVNYFDFPAVIEDKAELKIRYKLIKDKLLADVKTRLLSESELFFGDNYGSDYVFENDDSTIYIRLITIKQRLFQLVVISKGKNSTATENVKKYQKNVKDNFFNSFQITQLPEAKSQTVNLPADFGVSTDNNKLNVKYLGFVMDLPESWLILTKSQTELMKDIGSELIQNEKNKDIVDLSNKNTEILMMLSKTDISKNATNALLILAAERSSVPTFTAKAVIDAVLKNYIDENDKLIVNPTRTEIGGIEFYWAELENTEVKSKQRIYVGNRNGIIFEIFFSYQEEQDLNLFLKKLETAKFEKVEK
nr:hypothetical protein [Pyrinomonadaceae bacterium]